MSTKETSESSSPEAGIWACVASIEASLHKSVRDLQGQIASQEQGHGRAVEAIHDVLSGIYKGLQDLDNRIASQRQDLERLRRSHNEAVAWLNDFRGLNS